MQDSDLFTKHPPDNEQRLDQHGHIGEALDELLDARLKLDRPHHGWRARSRKRFHGTARQNISFATTTECSALCSKLMYERWGSGTDPRHSVPLGKTDMLNA